MGCSQGLFLAFINITNINILDESIRGQGNLTDVLRKSTHMKLQREKSDSRKDNISRHYCNTNLK